MFPTKSFQKNLSFSELNINFLINIFLNNLKLINILHPEDFYNSCNLELLKIYDKSLTCGKISFIPIDFLREFCNKNNFNIQNYNSEEEEKLEYIKLLLDKKILNNNFYKNNKFKNINLIYFRKYVLSSKLSKCSDFCKIISNENITSDNIDINHLKIKTIKTNDIIIDDDEWLSKYDLTNIILPKILTLKKNIKKDIFFIPLIFIKNNFNDENIIYSDILNRYNWDLIKNEKFILIFILYRSHFTSIIINRDIKIDNKSKKIAYFFNSCGYNPDSFRFNKNFWFIDNSLKIYKHKIFKIDSYDRYNLPIESFTKFLYEKFHITNFIFNNFSIQNFNSECGIFSSMFLYFFLDFLKKNNDNEIINLHFKFIYFNMINLGGDMTYSMFRGLFFFTNQDIVKNNLNEIDYLNSPFIYDIKNIKFHQYNKLYNKSIKEIENIYLKLKDKKIFI